MTDTIKVGIVGAHATRGWARAVHLPALSALPDYTITAVAGTSTESARAAADVWGAAHAFDDPYALMAHPDVDLVVIGVQLPRRDGLVAAAIAAGKHVYCEWPLALDAASAESLRAQAAEAGVQHAVGLQSRNHPAVRHLHDLVADGRIGEVLSASLSYSLASPDVWSSRYADLFDATKGVNHVAVVGGHSLDMFRSALGDFTELSATLATRITTITLEETSEQLAVTSPDQIVVNGLLESGAAASAHFMTGGPAGEGFRIEVHGRTGRLVLRASDDSLVGPEFTLHASDGPGTQVRLPIPARRLLPDAPVAVGNVAEVYTDLARGIRSGEPITPDFGTAASIHRVLDAIRESASTGTRLHLR
ncbi:Gfo/Idh/MocA family protein [Yinghuangia soli]|uniref:Gfo/Idh/MocA family oxidoreductase n=1 Tax=Yinghuangia soli TaxID=2908204 RepID=A0AA41Q7S1_9ACTN|nr:Gfo/Idh/MocA family oxidoreductase [Yinghuangia soli]MCF2533155.1 Gfo/Idh/MocA family oxidoreductase [Yinghuangia soli]